MPIRPIRPAGENSAELPSPPPAAHPRPRTRPGSTPTPPSAAPPKRAHHIVDRSGPNWDENGDYLVGKYRPPASGTWQKGQSGNPRGPKPRERKDPLSEFHEEVLAEFTARVNGGDVKLNLGTFALQLIKAGAAKGSVKSQQLLLELFLNAIRHQVDANTTPEMEAWEQQLIDTMVAQYNLPASPVVRKSRDVGEQLETEL